MRKRIIPYLLREMSREFGSESVVCAIDGIQDGYDTDGTRAIAEAMGIPMIAPSFAGKLENIYDALTAGEADAALAAGIFHFSTCTVKQVKDGLRGRGVGVW